MEGVFTQQLDPATKKWLSLYLYTNVENMPELHEKLVSGKLKCCILKASLIIDPMQIAVAANKAVRREKTKILITKSVFTEMIYLMSSSDSISSSLTRFGAHTNDKNIVVAVIYDTENKDFPNEIISHVKGQLTSFSRIKEFHDEDLIRKAYKIGDTELTVSTLLDSIISRIGGSYPIKIK